MKIREYFFYFLVSPAGAVSTVAALAAGLAVGAAVNMAAGSITAGAALLGLHLAAFFTGLGSRFAVRERDRRIWQGERLRLENVRQSQARLASMRIGDPAIKRLAETAAMRAGEYYSACIRRKTHDPKATGAAAECLELLDVFLTELDESATERRFDMPDANPFADAKERISAALNERIAILGKSTLDIEGGISAKDRLEIKEQLL